MSRLDFVLFAFSLCGLIAAYLLVVPPLSWAAIGTCALFAIGTLFAAEAGTKPVVRLAGLTWSMEDFVRGWLITGRVGSGKTRCAINTITFQVFKNVSGWGGICLDQKGLYWETLVKMAAYFHRQHDLILLQTKPVDASRLWRP